LLRVFEGVGITVGFGESAFEVALSTFDLGWDWKCSGRVKP
jgi:hypothetical protein